MHYGGAICISTYYISGVSFTRQKLFVGEDCVKCPIPHVRYNTVFCIQAHQRQISIWFHYIISFCRYYGIIGCKYVNFYLNNRRMQL